MLVKLIVHERLEFTCTYVLDESVDRLILKTDGRLNTGAPGRLARLAGMTCIQ